MNLALALSLPALAARPIGPPQPRGRVNMLPDSTFAGAVAGVIGSGGAAPARMAMAPQSGISMEVVGAGVEDGREYLDVRWFGTASGNAFPALFLASVTAIAAAAGESWSLSMYIRLAPSSQPYAPTGGTTLRLEIIELDAAGAFVGNSVSAVAPTAAAARYQMSRTLNGAATTCVRPALVLRCDNGFVADVTFRISGPQSERGATATDYQRIAAVALAGTPAATGTSGAHTSVEVADYNHPGGSNGALAVVITGRPQAGGEQAVGVTWNGVAVPERIDTSDGGAVSANDAVVWIGLLAGAASGTNALSVSFDKTQSDSVVQCISMVNVDQSAPVAGTAAGFDASSGASVATAGRTGAAASLFLAGAGIAMGSFLDGMTAGWADLGVYKSDAGTSTSTCALVVAHRAPTASGADPLTVTWGDSTTRGRALGLVEVAAA